MSHLACLFSHYGSRNTYLRLPFRLMGVPRFRNEEVLAYQVSRQRSFENYLLAHSSFDTPSTSRGSNIGEVFERDGRLFFRLFCVVKYKTKEYSGENAGMLEFE